MATVVQNGKRVFHDLADRVVAVAPVRNGVREKAQEALQRSGYAEMKRVSCRYHEGVVILQGRVSSYHMKQIAQTLVHQLDIVEELVNQLDVVYPPEQ